jgi:hypothetical protein
MNEAKAGKLVVELVQAEAKLNEASNLENVVIKLTAELVKECPTRADGEAFLKSVSEVAIQARIELYPHEAERTKNDKTTKGASNWATQKGRILDRAYGAKTTNAQIRKDAIKATENALEKAKEALTESPDSEHAKKNVADLEKAVADVKATSGRGSHTKAKEIAKNAKKSSRAAIDAVAKDVEKKRVHETTVSENSLLKEHSDIHGAVKDFLSGLEAFETSTRDKGTVLGIVRQIVAIEANRQREKLSKADKK